MSTTSDNSNYRQAIDEIVHTVDLTRDSVAKAIAIAYWMGREAAAKSCCNAARSLIAAMVDRAGKCRYHKMASAIIGDVRRVYSSDYAGDITGEFGNDLLPQDVAEIINNHQRR